MSENTTTTPIEPQQTQTPQPEAITVESAMSFLQEKGNYVISQEEVAALKNTGETQNEVLKGLYDFSYNSGHKAATGDVNRGFETTVFEMSGVERTENEKATEYAKRAFSTNKQKLSDADQLSGINKDLQKQNGEYLAQINEYKGKEKRNSFEAQFTNEFSKVIDGYDITEDHKNLLKKDISNSLYSNLAIEDGKEVLRVNGNPFDSKGNPFTIETAVPYLLESRKGLVTKEPKKSNNADVATNLQTANPSTGDYKAELLKAKMKAMKESKGDHRKLGDLQSKYTREVNEKFGI